MEHLVFETEINYVCKKISVKSNFISNKKELSNLILLSFFEANFSRIMLVTKKSNACVEIKKKTEWSLSIGQLITCGINVREGKYNVIAVTALVIERLHII